MEIQGSSPHGHIHGQIPPLDLLQKLQHPAVLLSCCRSACRRSSASSSAAHIVPLSEQESSKDCPIGLKTRGRA